MPLHQTLLWLPLACAVALLGACDSDPTIDNIDTVIIDRITVSEASYDDIQSDGTGPDIYVSILVNGIDAFDTRNVAVGGISEEELPVTIVPDSPIGIRMQAGRAISVEIWDRDSDPIEGTTDDLMGESEEVNLEQLIEEGAPRTRSFRERAGTPRMSATLHLDYD